MDAHKGHVRKILYPVYGNSVKIVSGYFLNITLNNSITCNYGLTI